jgi:hypothetical protein
MDDHDDLIQRLQRLGRQPVDPARQEAHLAAMAPVGRSPMRAKVRVAGAFLAGLLVGGSGLAVAGALPDSAQNVAHTMFEQVGVQVPQPERYHDPEECGAEVKANHGEYVRDDKSLARTDCGKPTQAGGKDAGATPRSGQGGPGGPAAKGERGPCQGPPPWAGNATMSPEDKAAAQAEREARCGANDDDASVEEAPESEAAPDTTTTTAEPTTTTVAEPTTTTTAAATTTTTG